MIYNFILLVELEIRKIAERLKRLWVSMVAPGALEKGL